MNHPLLSWDREYFVNGGMKPYLFFAVMGNIDISRPLSSSTHRTMGVAKGLEVVYYSVENDVEVFTNFRSGYSWELFAKNEPQSARLAISATNCMVIKGTPLNEESLDYLRDTIGLISHLLSANGSVVYDPQTLQWWGKRNWSEEFFEPLEFNSFSHVAIFESETGVDKKWLHTRGLRKFGRPDVSIRHVEREMYDSSMELLERLVDFQARGGIVEDGKEITMSSFPEGGYLKVSGSLDDPDFNNLHVEIVLN